MKYKLFTIIFLLLVSNIADAQERTNFVKLDQEFTGSSEIHEDSFGFIWISDNSGLYQYDGYEFTFHSYREIFGNDFENDQRFIIEKDSLNSFWIATMKGELSRINTGTAIRSFKDTLKLHEKSSSITAIRANRDGVVFGTSIGDLLYCENNSDKIISLPSISSIGIEESTIHSLAFTDENTLWVSIRNGGIYKLLIEEQRIEPLEGPINYNGQEIRLESGIHGDLWIATEFQGLFCYTENEKSNFKCYDKFDGLNSQSIPLFIELKCDKEGNIWAGTDGDGLFKISPETGKIIVFQHEEINNSSISNNTITQIQEDSHGNIWIIDKNGKINILQKTNEMINYYNGLESNKPASILSVIKARDGSIWLGTDGNGINRVFKDNHKVQYNNKKTGAYYFAGKYIQFLKEDSNGNIWIATYQNGLWIYNSKTNRFSKIKVSVNESKLSQDTRFIFEDSSNRIWATSGSGIHVFSLTGRHLTTFDYFSKGLFGMHSYAISEDDNRNIWVAVNGGGLFKFNENIDDFSKSYFKRFNYYNKSSNDFRNYNIQSLTPDSSGNLWILCTSGMLIKYNMADNSYESLSEYPSIKDIVIASIIFETPQTMWLSSSDGIHRLNLATMNVVSFYQIDGLQGNNFRKRAAYQDDNGVLYFGGNNGLNSFRPSDISKNEIDAQLYIKSIEVLNKPITSILPEQIPGRVENVSELNLSSGQSSFSFQFSAIDNLLNSNFHYAYRLRGFEGEWIESKNNRTATYTNIPYGDYVFEVKAGSKKAQWDIQTKTIAIKIKAPWWFSTPAFIVYCILIFLLLYGFYVWYRLKRKLEKEEWQHKKEKELYALKMNFFAKMSHEIQSPLTLILGPIEDMLDRAGSKGNELLKQRLTIIKNNAYRLSRIATELMTVRNKELGKLRIFASRNNLTNHLNAIALSFKEQARFKKIDFIQSFPQEDQVLWYDKDKIEHIMYNLLSNAFKFTPKEGRVELNIKKIPNETFIEISVKDSGPGIPKDELDDIFELFYQSDLGKHEKGFGIGLALTKELIDLHNGTIHVSSTPEEGTTFSVKLSTSEDLFSDNEKIRTEESDEISESLIDTVDTINKEYKPKHKHYSYKKYKILIVEDNIEMQIFLRDILSKTYSVLIAENGKEGVQLALEHIPDLILSDIMMPVMDGIEMCTMLQKNKKSAHIPIVLLTAKNTTHTKLRGLKSGAIEYIQKPFNIFEVLLKVNNIIDNKERVLSQYKTELASSPKEALGLSKDDQFIEDLVTELNKHIEESDFKLEDLSKSLNMSYSVIYRKCQDITGLTLVEFVRSMRLKKAAYLIISKGYNISEAAFMVGYKDSKYFTKCFKKEFGKTPNYLRKEARKFGVLDVLKKYNIKST